MTDTNSFDDLLELPIGAWADLWMLADGSFIDSDEVPIRRSRPALDAIVSALNPNRGSGAYILALRDSERRSRLVGESSCLYIGQGKASRFEDLLTNHHSTARARLTLGWARVREKQRDNLPVRVAFKETTRGRLQECVWLNQYALAHGELPPMNSRWEKWLCARLLRAVTKAACDACPPQANTLPWRVTLADYPSRTPSYSTWAYVWQCDPHDASEAKYTYQGGLGWYWPEGWRTGHAAPPPGMMGPGSLVLHTANSPSDVEGAWVQEAGGYYLVRSGFHVLDAHPDHQAMLNKLLASMDSAHRWPRKGQHPVASLASWLKAIEAPTP